MGKEEAMSNYTSVDGHVSLPVVHGVVAPSTVPVIAPSNLPAGYQFTVDTNGRHVVVSVVCD